MEQSYKEKYEQAIERLKQWDREHPCAGYVLSDRDKFIFPELAESEDEKIRKELLDFCKNRAEKYSNDPKYKNISAWIAWLEKQGKCETDCHRNHQDANYPNGCITLEDFNGGEGFYKLNLDYLNKKQVEEVEEMVRTWNKESKTSNENIKSCIGICLTDANEQRFKDYNTSLKDCLDWLKKQGDYANFRDKAQVGDRITKNEDGVLVNLSQLERVAKPSDKVKPKFHEGEWITDGDYIWKIVEIKRLDYTLLSQDDNIVVDTISHVDEQFHSFTIQDAKDGDVLATSAGAFIYNGNNGGGSCPGCYCGINTLGRFQTGVEHHWTGKKVYPATKEQRDLLFQKMKEAGYEWDSYTKELKKIEQKPTEWSEEDEVKINRIVACLENLNVADNNILLKDVDWLKSLRHQNTYNPYKAVVKSIAEMCKHYDKASHSGLRDFYDNVKVKCKDAQEYDKMFPQAQWKPSELQLGCLSDAIEYYNSLGYPASKLKELYEQLKKL